MRQAMRLEGVLNHGGNDHGTENAKFEGVKK